MKAYAYRRQNVSVHGILILWLIGSLHAVSATAAPAWETLDIAAFTPAAVWDPTDGSVISTLPARILGKGCARPVAALIKRDAQGYRVWHRFGALLLKELRSLDYVSIVSSQVRAMVVDPVSGELFVAVEVLTADQGAVCSKDSMVAGTLLLTLDRDGQLLRDVYMGEDPAVGPACGSGCHAAAPGVVRGLALEGREVILMVEMTANSGGLEILRLPRSHSGKVAAQPPATPSPPPPNAACDPPVGAPLHSLNALAQTEFPQPSIGNAQALDRCKIDVDHVIEDGTRAYFGYGAEGVLQVEPPDPGQAALNPGQTGQTPDPLQIQMVLAHQGPPASYELWLRRQDGTWVEVAEAPLGEDQTLENPVIDVFEIPDRTPYVAPDGQVQFRIVIHPGDMEDDDNCECDVDIDWVEGS